MTIYALSTIGRLFTVNHWFRIADTHATTLLITCPYNYTAPRHIAWYSIDAAFLRIPIDYRKSVTNKLDSHYIFGVSIIPFKLPIRIYKFIANRTFGKYILPMRIDKWISAQERFASSCYVNIAIYYYLNRNKIWQHFEYYYGRSDALDELHEIINHNWEYQYPHRLVRVILYIHLMYVGGDVRLVKSYAQKMKPIPAAYLLKVLERVRRMRPIRQL
jgi:hypothetical protein